MDSDDSDYDSGQFTKITYDVCTACSRPSEAVEYAFLCFHFLL